MPARSAAATEECGVKSAAARHIAAARTGLTEAGYKGQPIKMIANKRYSFVFDSAVLVQAMAEAIGLKIDIDLLQPKKLSFAHSSPKSAGEERPPTEREE
jgi:hypothetical protein